MTIGLNRRLVIGAVAGACLSMPAAAQGLSGSYTAQGRNADGSTYSGTVQLTHSANVVSLAWSVGGSNYIGTGVLDGRVITVNWGADTPVVYVVMPDGTLHGTWADGYALERLTPN